MFGICIWLRKQNYHIYIDNFYMSFELFEHFHYRGVACTGTLRNYRIGFIDIEKIDKKRNSILS